MVALLFLALWAFMAVVKKKSLHYLLHHWHAAIVSVIYYFYINMTRVLLRIFTCTHVDDEVEEFSIATFKYWVEDTDLKCYKGIHLALTLIAGVPLLVLISIGMPLGLLVIFLLQHKSLVNRNVFQLYGFLYSSYRVDLQYWEVIVMLRKALMASVAVFAFSLGPNLQAILASGILITSMGVHVLKMPFVLEGPNLNRLESISLASSYVVFFMALVFNDPNSSTTGRVIASVILIGAVSGAALNLVVALMTEVSKGIDITLVEHNIEVRDDTTTFRKFSLLFDLGVGKIVKIAQKGEEWIHNTGKRQHH